MLKSKLHQQKTKVNFILVKTSKVDFRGHQLWAGR